MEHGMETAAAHLGGQPSEMKPMKEFHAKELHDGTYHVMMHHGDPMKPPMEGSAHDVDGVVDHMMHHFGGEGGGEELIACHLHVFCNRLRLTCLKGVKIATDKKCCFILKIHIIVY